MVAKKNAFIFMTCVATLSMPFLYLVNLQFSRTKNSPSNCPIPLDSTDVCIHSKTNWSHLKTICNTIHSATTNNACKNYNYSVIVVPREFMEDVSEHVKQIMIVQGYNLGPELDKFVQRRSHWMINPFGGDGFEILMTVREDGTRMKLQAHLDRLQHRCVNFFEGVINPFGYGSNWHTAGLGLAWSLYYNMTLFIQPDKENNHQTKLPFQGFIPVTSCSYSDLETAFSIHPPETNFTKWKHSTINFYSQQLDVQSLMKDQEIILPEYKSQGLFWWRSMLTFYVIRPNYQTREWLRQHGNTAAQTAITTMLRSRECISIHVRHSDKGNEVDLLPLKAYMTKANEIRNMTGILNIYLMTDDQLVVNEARQEYGRNSTEREGGFEIHVQEMMRSNAGWKDDIKKGRVSPQESLKQFLIDLFSAVQCRYSIVTYSSNVGRLVGEIKYAMNNQDPKTTVFSLDYEWTMYP